MISEKLQGLYNSYKSLSPSEHFVPCGVVNEEAYEARKEGLLELQEKAFWCGYGHPTL